MVSLIIRNLIFTILHPGIVAGLVPYLILKEKINDAFIFPWPVYKYFGAAGIVIGLIFLLWCITSFAISGRGTLSPADPTKKLVTKGLYKFTRNPMYVGVVLILMGQTLMYLSASLLIYSTLVLIGFNIFIIFIEEPRLKKDFGLDYYSYCQKVRRWI